MRSRLSLLLSFVFLVLCGCNAATANDRAEKTQPAAQPYAPGAWPEGCAVVTIPSSVDGTPQHAYYRPTSSAEAQPLLVSLHTWSGDYTQEDDLAPLAATADWNYIHPDFRGPNRTPDACMSEKAIVDIDDAIAYAMEHGRVDEENIFVAGSSGGGYATVGMYVKSRHPVKAFLAWVPITDIRAWYYQSVARELKYAEDILGATSSGEALDEDEALARSPLHWPLPERPRARLELFAGIHDGYTGSVPISHSLLFYNRLVETYGPGDTAVTGWEFASLLSRGAQATGEMIGDRAVYLHRETPYTSVTIFEGGHEMLPEVCFERMAEMVGE